MITEVNDDGTLHLRYTEDNETESNVDAGMVRALEEVTNSSPPPKNKVEAQGGDRNMAVFTVGQSIEARYEGGGTYYTGKIQKVAEGKYDILYSDGGREKGITALHLIHFPSVLPTASHLCQTCRQSQT